MSEYSYNQSLFAVHLLQVAMVAYEQPCLSDTLGEIGSVPRLRRRAFKPGTEEEKLYISIHKKKRILIIQLKALIYSNLPHYVLHTVSSLSTLSLIFLFFSSHSSLSLWILCPNCILLCSCPQEDEAVSPDWGLIQFITRLYCNGSGWSSVHVPTQFWWCNLWDPLITQLKGRIQMRGVCYINSNLINSIVEIWWKKDEIGEQQVYMKLYSIIAFFFYL